MHTSSSVMSSRTRTQSGVIRSSADAIRSRQQKCTWYVHTSSSGMMPAAGTRISEHALSNVRSAAPTSSGELPN